MGTPELTIEEKFSKKKPWPYEFMETKIRNLPPFGVTKGDSFWSAYLLFSYALNARQGELFSLTNTSIEFDPANPAIMRISIYTEKLGKHQQPYRTIPINSEIGPFEKYLFDKIKEFLALVPVGKEFRLFRDWDWTIDYNFTSLLRYARYYSKKLLKCNHHFLRHCRLTHYVTRFNFNVFQLQQVAGWTEFNTAVYYIHLSGGDIEKQLQLIAEQGYLKAKEGIVNEQEEGSLGLGNQQ